MVDRLVGAELTRAGELRLARRRDDHPSAQRLCDRERRRGHAAAYAPDEDGLALAQPGARDEHAVGGLEHERERSRVLERDLIRQRVDILRRHDHELCVRAVEALADDRDPPVAVLDSGIDHDALAGVGAETCAVGAEDARLRHRRETLADPEIQMVERGGAQLNEHLAVARLGIGSILVDEHARIPVDVDAYRFHGTIRP